MFLGIFLRKNEIKEVGKVFLFEGLNLNKEKTTRTTTITSLFPRNSYVVINK